MELTLSTEEQKAFFLLMGIPGQGVNLTDEDSLKKAFRIKAKKSHPDLAVRLGKDPRMMQMRFQELNEAFNILMERIQKEQKNGITFQNSQRESATPASDSSYTRKSWFEEKKKKEKQAPKGFEGTGYHTSNKESFRKQTTAAGGSEDTQRSGRNEYKDFYFNGKTPERNLRFAEYLYYSGTISWTDLIQALVWQYRNRPKIGEMATETGLMDFNNVLDIIKQKKPGELFGEAAIRLGFLNKENLISLVRKQKQLDLPIGRYFVKSSKFSIETLNKKLTENRRHNFIYDDQSDS